MKDHQIRELVDTLKNIAIEFHDSQQLRQLLSVAVCGAFAGVDDEVESLEKKAIEVLVIGDQHSEYTKKILLETISVISLHVNEYIDISSIELVEKQDHYRGGSRKKGGRTKYQRT